MLWLRTSRKSKEFKKNGKLVIKTFSMPDKTVDWALYAIKWRPLLKPWVSRVVYTYAFKSDMPLVGSNKYAVLDINDEAGARFVLYQWLEYNGAEYDEILEVEG